MTSNGSARPQTSCAPGLDPPQHGIRAGRSLSRARGYQPRAALRRRRVQFVGFKGGSEPGVITFSFLVQTTSGRWKSVVGGWNRDDAGVDETKFAALIQRRPRHRRHRFLNRGMRVLFLISDTGGGHRAAANAISAALQAIDPAHEVTIEDALVKAAPFPGNHAPEIYKLGDAQRALVVGPHLPFDERPATRGHRWPPRRGRGSGAGSWR